MKKKTIYAAAIATMLAQSLNAQTRIGETTGDWFNHYLPAELTSNGEALLCNDDGVLTFYDKNLTATEMQIPERSMYLDYFNLDNPAATAVYKSQGVVFSQALFNNDAEFEYLRYTATNEHIVTEEWGSYTRAYITKLEAVTMSGTVVFSLEALENSTFGEVTDWGDNDIEFSSAVHALLWGGAFYLAVQENDTVTEESKYGFYRINQQTQSIARVEGSLPISVFPSVADRDQTITVELGENNNATEVQVVNVVGQVVKSVAVQPGQCEVRLRASDLGSGMHIVGARGRKKSGACKIIVK